ncbi:ECF transporter S component [Alkaliphilus hydrothermalis]|uniref:Membrane protein n=1 Tax=Alkaliphilus hydrothermalis TaxID=1482730 RepID=A0ABS2NSQ8_9FIRM|nr:ECF transporter S component [Alkaliphilus hydrothermalis]MBM7615897.1 putative membrane protein [Alkaliphilus hydrothermalis]
MRRNSTQDIALIGLLIALVAVATMAIKVPMPTAQGYIHLGDSMVFLTAVMFGRRKGAIAGGVGSALADLLLGYNQYVIPTLIIKGLMGFIVGAVADQESQGLFNIRNILAFLVGAAVMATGYMITNIIFYGDVPAALVGLVGDLIQSSMGAVIFIPIGMALKKSDYFKNFVLK